MACKEDTTLDALRNMTQCSICIECPICIETFDDPRVLPCTHAFCLKCLEKTQSKTKAQCALCRQPFDIPMGGLSKLPRHAIIPELIDLSKEPKSSENSETEGRRKMTTEKAVKLEAPLENIKSAGAMLPKNLLDCGNCNNCEHCSSALDERNNEGVQETVALNEQIAERSTETAEMPKQEDTESLCDVCILNNSDGNQKVSTAALYCIDCNENQCEKCSAEHMRQRVCKNHTVVSLEDHLKENLLHKEEHDEETLNTTIFCDVCLDNNESGTAAIATLRCITCTENQCDDCSKEHKRQRVCKDHHIVVLDDQMKHKLIKMKEMARSTGEDIICDVCAENSENDEHVKVAAMWRCADCDENQCDECNREHKRQRLSRDHQIVVLDDQLKDKLLKMKEMVRLNNEDIFCDICNSESGNVKISATWQCVDCDENQCSDCSREHKRQRLSRDHKGVALDEKMKEKLLKTKQNANSIEVDVLCDICRENNEIGKEKIAATFYCIQCKENHCDVCSKEHKKQRLLKSHEMVVLDAQMKKKLSNVEEVEKMPDLQIVCDLCAADSELRETWSAAALYCVECDENHCNNCSKEHKKQSLFRSHEIITIGDYMKNNIYKMKAEIEIVCDMCAGNCANQTAEVLKATLYCVDCNENQCEECNRSHLRQTQFREHQVVALQAHVQQNGKHPRTCSVHIKDQLKLYCFTCQEVICIKCTNKEHGSHEYQIVSKVAKGFLIEVDGYLENLEMWLQQIEVIKPELQTKSLEAENVQKATRSRKSDHSHNMTIMPKDHLLNTRTEMKKELHQHLVNVCALKKQCSALRTQLSSVSICIEMNELRTKFEELQRQQEFLSPAQLHVLPRGSSSFEGYKSSDPASPYCNFRRQMKKLVREELTHMFKDGEYSKIQQMIERPHIEEDEINTFWRIAFPYIIQRVKMWNGDVLTAQNLAELVIRKQKQKGVIADSQSSASGIKTSEKLKTSETAVHPVSKLDCLTYLINIADCIVAHDILRIMSKFPMAIPLVVQDIHHDDKYIVTIPILQNNVIKWESKPGQIAENHLFSSPFRMVAAIRLGSNKIGKSTILNQLMSKQFMFSSKGEAGGRYGRPCTLDGAVEIVWLTQETCSGPTWKTTMSEYYRGNTDDVAILANLHGNPLQHVETLKFLEKYVCSFIVFLMPNFSVKELDDLKQRIQIKDIIQVFVDPQENTVEESDLNTIRTESLSSDDTLHTIRDLLQDSLSFGNEKICTSIEETCHQYASLRYAELLQCKESAQLVEMAEILGCGNIKQLLSRADIKAHTKWDNSLKRLITLFLDIICLAPKDAKKHLTHLETNLSQISAKESIAARAEVSQANKKLRQIVKAPKCTTNGGDSQDRQVETNLKKAQHELKIAMDKVDNTNLGQEHFFRTLGNIYENSLEVADFGDLAAVHDLPKHFADLLINGHAIEMLNGDSGKIQLTWLKAICDNVLKKLPNLKVFVISIIGLQSSGKSTLLNALFSCRFAVSVGRCSRGLFMRMIFLNEALRHSHGYDAIILIDTEGLSSPEKMNDPKANQKDRLMATYAIGISNLTMVNILGEGMTEMTEILQIAIVAMARLRGGGIKPDILMVQHLQERNVSKIDQAKGQFCEAINKAFDLISKNDVEIGLASVECLAELTARIHSGDLFQHFGPFKDGSSVNSPPSESYHDDIVSLLETILKRTSVSRNKTSFGRWCNHFESYWTCVQAENFALNFKNVKHITDFLYFEKKIAKVRELLDRAMRCHKEMFSRNIREQVSCQVVERRKKQTDAMQRKKLLEDIEQQMQLIPHSCPDNCEACRQFNDSHVVLLEELSTSEWIEDTKRSIEKQKTRLREITMNMLGQVFDGSLVRQGCFSEFSSIIAKELNDALLNSPHGLYSPEEQKRITRNIWELLRGIAANMEHGLDLETRLSQTLLREYSGVLPTILKNFRKEITFENLANSRAIKSFWNIFPQMNYRLSDDQMNNLMNTISQLIESVFGRRCVDFSTIGLDFEEGMVSDFRTEFPEAIKRFEDRFRMKLEGTFKMNLQIYALQHFRSRMMDLQKLWDSQNNPTEILQQKKEDYITEIETRLKSGFSSAGEGEVVATKLYNAMKKRAIQAGYEKRFN